MRSLYFPNIERPESVPISPVGVWGERNSPHRLLAYSDPYHCALYFVIWIGRLLHMYRLYRNSYADLEEEMTATRSRLANV